MSSRPTVPMYAPDGTLGDVPYDQVSSALRAGGHIGVNMQAPDGTHGVVPAERLQAASKAGGRVIPYNLSNVPKDQKGILDTFVDDVKSVFSGLFSTNEGDQTAGMSRVRALQTQTAQENAEVAARHASEKAAGYNLPYRVAADIATPLGTNVAGMEQAAKEGNSDAVVGHMLAGQALAAAPLAAEGLAKVSSKIATSAGPAVGTALRTETGALRPSVKAAARVAGGTVGHAVLPGIGSIVGYESAPALAEALIPERPGAATLAERRAVPVSKSPVPGGYTGPRSVPKLEVPEAAPVLSPAEAAAPETMTSEGRPATWTNERVIQLSTQGNRDAISQAVRRGLLLPENVRYVMGDADYPGGVSNPRSVTRFSPTGEPITQGEALPKSQQTLDNPWASKMREGPIYQANPDLFRERYGEGDSWYHGTTASFEEFKNTGIKRGTSDWNSKLGTHFAADRGVAEDFASGRYSGGKEGRVIEAKLNITNPATFNLEADLGDAALKYAMSKDLISPAEAKAAVPDFNAQYSYGEGNSIIRSLSKNRQNMIANSFKKYLQGQGYDGIVYGNSVEGHFGNKAAIVFEPEQIKQVASQ